MSFKQLQDQRISLKFFWVTASFCSSPYHFYATVNEIQINQHVTLFQSPRLDLAWRLIAAFSLGHGDKKGSSTLIPSPILKYIQQKFTKSYC